MCWKTFDEKIDVGEKSHTRDIRSRGLNAKWQGCLKQFTKVNAAASSTNMANNGSSQAAD